MSTYTRYGRGAPNFNIVTLVRGRVSMIAGRLLDCSEGLYKTMQAFYSCTARVEQYKTYHYIVHIYYILSVDYDNMQYYVAANYWSLKRQGPQLIWRMVGMATLPFAYTVRLHLPALQLSGYLTLSTNLSGKDVCVCVLTYCCV